MDPLQVDPDQLTANSDGFHAIGQNAQDIGKTLQGGLDLLGDFPGPDATGRVFSAGFNPSIRGVATGLEDLGTFAINTGTRLQESADDFSKSDEVNADSVPHISSDLP